MTEPVELGLCGVPRPADEEFCRRVERELAEARARALDLRPKAAPAARHTPPVSARPSRPPDWQRRRAERLGLTA